MKIVEIIPSKRFRHTERGTTASIYGAHPGATDPRWVVETVGWTWRLDNGSIGLGRVPAKTREEAEEVMNRFNALGARSCDR